MNEHPKITELLEQRQTRKKRPLKLSFEEKIEIIGRLRELQHNRGSMETRRTVEQFDDGGSEAMR